MVVSAQKEIKLKLVAFDHRILDKASKDIVNTVNRTGADVKGPIPLPTEEKCYAVNRSPHVDKESGERFKMLIHKRLFLIKSSHQTIDALMKLDLPAGVEVGEIKFKTGNE